MAGRQSELPAAGDKKVLADAAATIGKASAAFYGLMRTDIDPVVRPHPLQLPTSHCSRAVK